MLFASFQFTFCSPDLSADGLYQLFYMLLTTYFCHFAIMAEPIAKRFVDVTDSDMEEILEVCVPEKTKQASIWLDVSFQ